MKAIPTIAAAVLVLGTLPAAAESTSEDRKARAEEARAALLDDLGLEGDQRSQVEEILQAHAEKGGELFSEHRESRGEGREQLRQSRREAREQRQALREETEGKLKEVLSEEQFSRLQELRKERRKERGGHHREGFSRGGEERDGKGDRGGRGHGGGRGRRGGSHH